MLCRKWNNKVVQNIMFLDTVHRPVVAEWNMNLVFVLMVMTNEPMEVGMWSRAINIPTNFHSNTAYKSLQLWWGHETLRLCLSLSVSKICIWQILPKMRILLSQNVKLTCILLVDYNFVLLKCDINSTRFVVLLIGFTSFTWTAHNIQSGIT